MRIRATAVLIGCVLCGPTPTAAQRLLERTPNLPNSVTALPGVLEASLPHRFTRFSGAEGLSTSTTFDLALGMLWLTPLEWTAGLRFAPSSHVVPGDDDEWEPYHRFALLRSGRGSPVDVTLTGAYNLTAHSMDGELAAAHQLGPLRVLGAARALSSPFANHGARFALAGGAVWHVLQRRLPVTVAADVGTLLDRDAGEDVAWSAGVQAGLPYTPIVFGLQASNTNTTTIEGASLGAGRTRYGFELNAPVELFGFVTGWFTPRERAREAVTGDASGAVARRVRIVGYVFTPAVVHVRAGDVIEWVNEDAVVHTVNAENAAFESGAIRAGMQWRARFDQPGRYPYYCGPHPFMKALVIVMPR